MPARFWALFVSCVGKYERKDDNIMQAFLFGLGSLVKELHLPPTPITPRALGSVALSLSLVSRSGGSDVSDPCLPCALSRCCKVEFRYAYGYLVQLPPHFQAPKLLSLMP